MKELIFFLKILFSLCSATKNSVFLNFFPLVYCASLSRFLTLSFSHFFFIPQVSLDSLRILMKWLSEERIFEILLQTFSFCSENTEFLNHIFVRDLNLLCFLFSSQFLLWKECLMSAFRLWYWNLMTKQNVKFKS